MYAHVRHVTIYQSTGCAALAGHNGRLCSSVTQVCTYVCMYVCRPVAGACVMYVHTYTCVRGEEW